MTDQQSSASATMRRGQHPNSRVALAEGAQVSNDRRHAERLAGLAWAREWRERNAPLFAEMYA